MRSSCSPAAALTRPRRKPTSEARAGTAIEETTTDVPPPSIDEPPPSARRLVGTWSRIGTAGPVRFAADREFRIARNEPDLEQLPYAVGTYAVDGATISLTGSCNSVWEGGLAGGEDPLDDELHVVVVEGGCGLVAETALTFVRIGLE